MIRVNPMRSQPSTHCLIALEPMNSAAWIGTPLSCCASRIGSMSARWVRPAQFGAIPSFSCSIVFARTTTSASALALADVVVLAKTIEQEKLGIAPNCAGRTHRADIDPILEAQQLSGVPIQAALFIGSSAIRQWVEGWDLIGLTRIIHDAVSYANGQGLEVMFVTEDTTR